jgi:DNA-directed RNA polymerase subunit N (RpoN/RPB10)
LFGENMPNYTELRKILELWESGTPKENIADMLGISRYAVRNCIDEYGSIAQFDRLHEQVAASNQSPQNTVRQYVISGYTRGKSVYNDDELIKAVAECASVAKVLERFGLKPSGGNYTKINKRIKELGLDTRHFKGSHDWARGQKSTFVRKRALSEIMVQDSVYTTSMLRKRLIAEGIFEHRCMSCGLDTWLDNKIPLEIDHINGDRYDNRLENLRLLCPNCHALTATYRGKNKKSSA